MLDEKMVEKRGTVPPVYDLDDKWNAYADLAARRVAYSSIAGGLVGLLFFRTRTTRWASVAFGAGLGIGSAYSIWSHDFKLPKKGQL